MEKHKDCDYTPLTSDAGSLEENAGLLAGRLPIESQSTFRHLTEGFQRRGMLVLTLLSFLLVGVAAFFVGRASMSLEDCGKRLSPWCKCNFS